MLAFWRYIKDSARYFAEHPDNVLAGVAVKVSYNRVYETRTATPARTSSDILQREVMFPNATFNISSKRPK